ncbi:MAG: permease [Gemmatimonadota bacterium]|nr:MAG: permease [Gemmatimonadota bacterium]
MAALRFGLVLLAELVPLFLLISTLVYLLVEALTPERIQRWLGGGSAYSTVPLATALGAATPFCTCSTVPIVNGMRLAGVPTAPLVAFLIASPLISPVAFALLWSVIGVEYAALYTSTGLLAAALGGVVVAHWNRREDGLVGRAGAAAQVPGCGCGASTTLAGDLTEPMKMSTVGPVRGSATLALPLVVSSPVATARFQDRVARAFVRSLSDLRKFALPLVAAVAVGAAIYGYVPEDLILKAAGPGNAWAVPTATLLSVPVYASTLVLLPLASTLLAKGVGIGAVTAFLMGANGLSLPEGILLSRIIPRGLLWRIVAVFTVEVIGIGYLFQAIAA